MALNGRYFNAQTTSLQASGNASKIVTVGGRIKGLMGLVGATPSNALYKGLDQLALDGITLYPEGSTYPDDDSLVLTNVLLTGLSHDAMDVRLRYETPTGFPGTALIYDVDSSLQAVQRDKYPGTNIPILVGWEGRAGEDGATKPISPKIPLDTAPFSYLRPVVRMSATLVRAGVLDDVTAAANADRIGVVNDAPWMGRATGSWLLTGYKSTTSRYAGTYSVRAEAIAKKGEDWRVLDLLRSRITGRLAIPDPDTINSALSAAYAFGKIGANDEYTSGFICHGPYPLDSFPALWSALIS